MRHTWRWCGRKDGVSIDDMLQAGVQGVVTALHHIATGAVWSPEEIARWQADLVWRRPTGATCMRFDFTDFAAFDIHVLQRRGATGDFPEEIRAEPPAASPPWTAPGAKDWRTCRLRPAWRGRELQPAGPARPAGQLCPVTDAILRRNFHAFLAQVAPVAQDIGVRFCCHPDEPPFGLLGLPPASASIRAGGRRRYRRTTPRHGTRPQLFFGQSLRAGLRRISSIA